MEKIILDFIKNYPEWRIKRLAELDESIDFWRSPKEFGGALSLHALEEKTTERNFLLHHFNCDEGVLICYFNLGYYESKAFLEKESSTSFSKEESIEEKEEVENKNFSIFKEIIIPTLIIALPLILFIIIWFCAKLG